MHDVVCSGLITKITRLITRIAEFCFMNSRTYKYIIQICSGITRDRVLNGELYSQRLQKLVYLHLFTDCFMKISLQSS